MKKKFLLPIIIIAIIISAMIYLHFTTSEHKLSKTFVIEDNSKLQIYKKIDNEFKPDSAIALNNGFIFNSYKGIENYVSLGDTNYYIKNENNILKEEKFSTANSNNTFSLSGNKQISLLERIGNREMGKFPLNELKFVNGENLIELFGHLYRTNESFYKTISLRNEINSVPVLMFHNVISETDLDYSKKGNDNYLEKYKFKEILEILNDNNIYPIRMDELYSWLNGKKDFSYKPVVLTFDDGSVNFYTSAFPEIKKLGYVATVFEIGERHNFEKKTHNHNVFAYNDDEKNEMIKSNLVEFHSHTFNMHDKKNNIGFIQLWDKKEIINDIKLSLRNLPKNRVQTFAYPFGYYDKRSPEILKEAGISMSFTTKPGNVKKGMEPELLPRVRVYGTKDSQYILKELNWK